jgi:phage virion morphogenesis protein
MSVALQFDLRAIGRLEKRIDEIAALDRRALLDAVGFAVENQTRRRIYDEKTGPDGVAWPNWSERYALSRHGNHSLLEGERDLLDSIDYTVASSGGAVEIGSNLVYAATHQAGDERRNIPARPYLGLSTDDEDELEQVVDDFLAEVLR